MVQEKVYEPDSNVEGLVRRLLKMPEDELERETPKILGSYPNTYTFTKANAERFLLQKRGSIPVVVVRPSIIGSSYREPCPGWIDSLAAAGAFVHAVGAGMSSHLQANKQIAFDVIPVDYVSNAILLATAVQAKKDEF